MLALVLSLYLMFTITGVASLHLASYSLLGSRAATRTVQDQYALESELSRVLWMVSAGVDPQQVPRDGDIVAHWDTTTQTLDLVLDRTNRQRSIQVDLRQETPFDYSVTASGELVRNGYVIHSSLGEGDFHILPQADLAYFMDHAAAIHRQSGQTFSGEDLGGGGIHIFTGHVITIENLDMVGTLVFTGRVIRFRDRVTVHADTSRNLPVLVFCNPRTRVFLREMHLEDQLTFEGAIVAAGTILIHSGRFTGPIMGNTIELQNNVFLDPPVESVHGRWRKGFGRKDAYPWPRRTGTFRYRMRAG